MARSKLCATYDDLLKLPDHVIGEIINGELIASPRPRARHVQASSNIQTQIGNGFGDDNEDGPQRPGGWHILTEPELRLGADVLVPDVAGWRRERMPLVPDVAAFELPPDWVCEVLSPSTELIDRGRKMDVYARARVPHLWLVNPAIRMLEIYALAGTSWTRVASHSGHERVRAVPFDAIEIELRRWWPEPEPEPETPPTG